MDDTTQDKPVRPLPFNNLYLVSGLAHGYNKWWMYLFTIVLTLFGYFAYIQAIYFPLSDILNANGYSYSQIENDVGLIFNSNALKVDRNLVFLLELLIFVFAALGLIAGISYIHQKTITSVLTGYEKFRFKRSVFAFTIWGVLIILALLVDYLMNPTDYVMSFNAGGFAVSLILMLFLMPIQTCWEEVLFRGYMLQGLSQLFRNGIIPLIVTSGLFALAHMTNPEVKEFGWKIMFTYYASFALFMGGLTLLDEGIELAFGIHLSNNLITSILVSSPHSVIRPYSVFETLTEDPYTEIILWAVMATIAFAIFWRKFKWKNFNLIIK